MKILTVAICPTTIYHTARHYIWQNITDWTSRNKLFVCDGINFAWFEPAMIVAFAESEILTSFVLCTFPAALTDTLYSKVRMSFDIASFIIHIMF